MKRPTSFKGLDLDEPFDSAKRTTICRLVLAACGLQARGRERFAYEKIVIFCALRGRKGVGLRVSCRSSQPLWANAAASAQDAMKREQSCCQPKMIPFRGSCTSLWGVNSAKVKRHHPHPYPHHHHLSSSPSTIVHLGLVSLLSASVSRFSFLSLATFAQATLLAPPSFHSQHPRFSSHSKLGLHISHSRQPIVLLHRVTCLRTSDTATAAATASTDPRVLICRKPASERSLSS